VERWIVARLRHHTFFALAEVNAAIGELLPALNARPFKKLPGSRHSLFETLDRPALKPLPAQPYEYAETGYRKIPYPALRTWGIYMCSSSRAGAGT
jgi:hypothetical protein